VLTVGENERSANMMEAASAIEHRTRREPAAGPRRLVGFVHLLINRLNISLNSF
jgi:hypothetical protein